MTAKYTSVFVIPLDIEKKLDELAVDDGISRSAVVRQLIKREHARRFPDANTNVAGGSNGNAHPAPADAAGGAR